MASNIKITETTIENFAIELLEGLGYEYLYGPDLAPEGDRQERQSFEDVLLLDRLENAIRRLNPVSTKEAREDAFKQVLRLNSTELINSNRDFHKLVTEGVNVSVRDNSYERGDYIKLIDFDIVENNEFLVVNQYTIIEDGKNKRPDVILFVNGIPLVVIELKNPAGEKSTVKSAFNQIQNYKKTIPSLFTYNGLIVISDGLEAKAGSLSAGYNRFMSWKTADGKTEASRLVGQMEILIKGMLNKKVLLDLIRHFIVFEQTKKEDYKTKITTIEVVKKLAAYHQYYAVNKAVESTIRAVNLCGDSVRESPAVYNLPNVMNQPKGDRKAGVIWHTQGSGKSLSMVFYSGKIVLKLNNPTILVITDRNDLDDQLFDTFASSQQLLRQVPVQAESREHLKKLLRVSSGGVVFSTIQKFQPEAGNVYERLSNRENIVVVADEAHRTQYGFKARNVDEKDSAGNVIGKKTVYGLAKYLRDALPHASFIGFTGTPIEKTDVNTPKVFGNYIDIYDFAQAIEDKATVPIYYESRLAKVFLSDEGKKLIKELDDRLDKEDMEFSKEVKAKRTKLNALIGSDERVKQVALDIVKHFENRQEVSFGKGMIVTSARWIAAKLYSEIIKLRPEWEHKDLDKGSLKVVMTTSSSDGTKFEKHHTSKSDRKVLSDRMKDADDELKLVIVCDMWLTGFDVPCLHTMYIDKPMKGHNLMQAIARVNRVYKDKPGGLIVDYLGIASDLKRALSFYSENGGKGDPAEAQEQAVKIMLEKLEVVSQLLHGFPYEDYFDADVSRKLSIILEAEEFILQLENGKKRFISEVTALSKAFAIAVPHEEAMDVKEEIAFFQTVKSRLVKFEPKGSGLSDEEMETTIKQVIDQALVSDKVIDVFDAAGIKKPDISILSEEFLLEVKGMKHKNVALEVLKKLLNDEIRIRAKTNIVQSKTLMEMLENAILKYQNKIISAVEVIEELIKMSKEMQNMDREPEEMGLSPFEYAFYSAVANNDSAKELMGKDKLRELAVVLFEKVRKNATIDWTIKGSVRSKLKVIVKRTLRQFGYPPDMQKLATDTVLKQAEKIADELTKM